MPAMIRKSFRIGVPAVLCIGVSAVVFGPPAPVDLRGAIAVVDLEKVMDAYPIAVEKHKELLALKEGFNDQLKRGTELLKQMELEANALQPGAKERQDAVLEMQAAEHRYKLLGELFTARLQQRREEVRSEVDARLRQGLAQFAKEKKLQLVLRVRSAPAAPGLVGHNDTNFVQDVLYHVPALDVTAQLIAYLQVPDSNPKPQADDGK
jgi:Skp family chaperone for outer membrane proteins